MSAIRAGSKLTSNRIDRPSESPGLPALSICDGARRFRGSPTFPDSRTNEMPTKRRTNAEHAERTPNENRVIRHTKSPEISTFFGHMPNAPNKNQGPSIIREEVEGAHRQADRKRECEYRGFSFGAFGIAENSPQYQGFSLPNPAVSIRHSFGAFGMCSAYNQYVCTSSKTVPSLTNNPESE